MFKAAGSPAVFFVRNVIAAVSDVTGSGNWVTSFTTLYLNIPFMGIFCPAGDRQDYILIMLFESAICPIFFQANPHHRFPSPVGRSFGNGLAQECFCFPNNLCVELPATFGRFNFSN